MSLRWRVESDYHAVSECGRYTVCKVVMGDRPWFEAWYTRPDGTSECLDLAPGENSAAMREVCARHEAALPPPELSFEGIRPPEDPR